MKLRIDDKLIFIPIKDKVYKNNINNSLYYAINQRFTPYNEYVISEIWHHKGYSLYGPNNSRNFDPYKKIYFWNGEIVDKKTYKDNFKNKRIIKTVDGKLLTLKEYEKNNKSNIIMIKGYSLTIPDKVIKDNFYTIKSLRKKKLKKILKNK